MTRPIVYVVDEDDAARRSLELWLHSLDYDARGFSSAESFLDAYEVRAPACLVADLRMPGLSGLELQERLRRDGDPLPVVFVSGDGNVRLAVQAMERGAFAFLEKPVDKAELREQVRRAHEQHARDHGEHARVRALREREARLTRRQRQVLERVMDGKPNKVIAADLGLAEKTVELHRSKMMRCMAARSLAELVRMTVELELQRRRASGEADEQRTG